MRLKVPALLGFALALAVAPSLASPVANVLLSGKLAQDSRVASAQLLDAIEEFNAALAEFERQDVTAYLDRMNLCTSLLRSSSTKMRAILNEFGDDLFNAKFVISDDKLVIVQQWLDGMGLEFKGNGLDTFAAFVDYVDETNDFLSENAFEDPSDERIGDVTFVMGERLGYLYRVGAAISEGFRSGL